MKFSLIHLLAAGLLLALVFFVFLKQLHGSKSIDKNSAGMQAKSKAIIVNLDHGFKTKYRERNEKSDNKEPEFIANTRKFLTQKEVEGLGITGLSMRADGIGEDYVEFSGLSDQQVLFLNKQLKNLEDEFKKVEVNHSEVIKDSDGEMIVFVKSFPDEGRELEGEFRYALRSELGEWQEDLFMKVNAGYFKFWFADFGQMEQRFTTKVPDKGRFNYELSTITPVEAFEPKSLAGNLSNRINRFAEFQESFVPSRFSHFFELQR